MKKPKKSTLYIILASVLVVAVSIFIFVKVNEKPNIAGCQFVIGDGYAMKTDPYPIAVSGTCNGAPATDTQIEAINQQTARKHNATKPN